MMNSAVIANIALLNHLICWSLNVSSLVKDGLSVPAIKALESLRDGWQTARIHDFSLLLIATVLVAVGVVLEGPELAYEVANAIKRWRGKVTSEHPPNWITAVGLLGWVIVLIGVTGEFWVDRWVNTDDDNIQSINTKLLQDAGTSSAKAKQASETAITNAGIANGIAIAAGETAGAAIISAGKAVTLADNASKEVAKTDANLKRVEEKYESRTLSQTKQAILSRFLQKSTDKPESPVLIQVFFGAPDGWEYAEELRTAIQAGGWEADIRIAQNGQDVKGVVLAAKPPYPRWAKALQEGLKSAGIGGDITIDPDETPGAMSIFIGRKN